MANRNFRNDQVHENVPDVTMAKFIENVGSYFPDLDMTVGQEQTQTPGTSGTVLTFSSPRTAAMFAAYQIGRRSSEYRPGAFVLARLENNGLVFDTSEVFIDHHEATRAQRNKSRVTRRPHLLFSTTQKTMEYAANVSNCQVSDFKVAIGQQLVSEHKDERFTPSQLKFLEKHFGSIMDSKIQESVDGLLDDITSALDGLKEELREGFVSDDDINSEKDVEQKNDLETQNELQFDSAGLTD